MIEAIDFSTRRLRAIAAAQERSHSTALDGGRVVDVATLELREADVRYRQPMIASVHPRGRFTAARGDPMS